MSKYYKTEDVIRKRAEDLADTSYWEYGNPKNVVEWIEVAEMEFKDLPTIDIVHCKDCKRWIGDSEWYEDREYKRCQNGGLLTAPNHYCAWGERIDNE